VDGEGVEIVSCDFPIAQMMVMDENGCAPARVRLQQAVKHDRQIEEAEVWNGREKIAVALVIDEFEDDAGLYFVVIGKERDVDAGAGAVGLVDREDLLLNLWEGNSGIT